MVPSESLGNEDQPPPENLSLVRTCHSIDQYDFNQKLDKFETSGAVKVRHNSSKEEEGRGGLCTSKIEPVIYVSSASGK